MPAHLDYWTCLACSGQGRKLGGQSVQVLAPQKPAVSPACIPNNAASNDWPRAKKREQSLWRPLRTSVRVVTKVYIHVDLVGIAWYCPCKLKQILAELLLFVCEVFSESLTAPLTDVHIAPSAYALDWNPEAGHGALKRHPKSPRSLQARSNLQSSVPKIGQGEPFHEAYAI